MNLPKDLILLHHCDQKVDVLDHELGKHPPLNLDLRPVLRQVRDQLEHIQVSEKVWCAENLLPMEQLLEF